MSRLNRSVAVNLFLVVLLAIFLVVDDNASNADVLGKQLRYWGATVVEANDGPTVLNILECCCGWQEIEGKNDDQPRGAQGAAEVWILSKVDIILIDRNMTGANGEELAEIIRESECHAATRLALMIDPHLHCKK